MATEQRDPSEDSNLLFGNTDDRLISGHSYDGIKEYDNPMPGWWVWTFIATIVFSVFYFVGIEFFGWINTYEDDLEESLAELEIIREAYAAENPSITIDESTLATFVEDETTLASGAAHFAAYCAACHGRAGEGTIGPNLTDDYWIHGGSLTEIFNVITTGVAAKGMPGWDGTLTLQQRAEVTAFTRSLLGSEPANAKAPEGELSPQ
ncbi:MAG: cbb3-type cytochrome c oxidase N-terminal domain-containing protein [Bacteroidota bacterium]